MESEPARIAAPPAGDAASNDAQPAGKAARSDERAPRGCPLVRHGITLEAAGWHLVEVRPSGTDELALWRVTIERYDQTMTMSLRDAADPDAAMEELIRYVQVDAS